MKKAWLWASQIAVWAVGLVTIFVTEPPRLAVGDGSEQVIRFVQFVLTILVGVVAALLSTRARSVPRSPAIASLLLLVVGIGLLGTYLLLMDRWTCSYPGGPMVTGQTLLPIASAYLAAHPATDCSQLLLDFGGQTTLIWAKAELGPRRLMLSGVFASLVISFALAAIAMAAALADRTRRHEASDPVGGAGNARPNDEGTPDCNPDPPTA